MALNQKEELKAQVEDYYNINKTSGGYGNSGDGDGVADSEIADMFGLTGEGHQYALTLSVSKLYDIGMIDIVDNY